MSNVTNGLLILWHLSDGCLGVDGTGTGLKGVGDGVGFTNTLIYEAGLWSLLAAPLATSAKNGGTYSLIQNRGPL